MSILLLPWAALLFGGFLFGKADTYRRMPVWTRMASSAVLVVAGWGFALQQPTPYTLLIALGMSLGLLGDLYMADLIPWPRPHVLGGMGSFGLGHVAYIAACLWFGRAHALSQPQMQWGSWVGWLVVAAVIWYFLIYRGTTSRSVLVYAALPYALLLASTVGVGMGLVWGFGDGRFLPFTIGAALFLFSDLLIAVDLFTHRRFFLMGDLIWLTYGPAQALIVYNLWLMGGK
ncbi:MAG: lysoplasmalogenase [Chloroflexi bacterium]|nr:lysoplasmalogenase [Chloroflexota bacterium]